MTDTRLLRALRHVTLPAAMAMAMLAPTLPEPSFAQEAAAPAPPSPRRAAFEAWLDTQVTSALDRRAETIAELSSAEAVRKRQAEVVAALGEMTGTLPATAGPLNARITRTQQRDGYRIEHLLYESLPGYLVTALVYVPDGNGPFPAVLGTAGHSETGKAHPLYQHAWISLARRGFVVLAYDPPGQGERREYLDPATGTSPLGVGVPEHVMTGQQLLLTGSHLAGYMVQDGRRAIDYLLTRKDVDGTRLAVAGNSGGGTQSAYLGALEPRLAATVVSCYMTSWRQLWRGPGPQDAEQVLPGFLSRGLDFGDFAIAAAPRGVLVSSAVQDYFPIAGARATYAQLRPLFATLDAPNRVAMVENDAPHGWSQPLREGAYKWLQTWLSAPEAPAGEAPLTPDDPSALHVTDTGQLATSVGSRTTRALNHDRARALAASRPAANAAAAWALVQFPQRPRVPRIVAREKVEGPAQRERLVIEVEPGVQIEGTLTRPAAGDAVRSALVIDDRGTASSKAADDLVRSGHVVLSLDVRGTGELAPQKGVGGYSGAYQFAARAWLLGTSVVAWQVRDIVAGLEVLHAEASGARERVVHARGQTAPSALLAAQVTRPDVIVLEDSLVSYLDLTAADTYEDASLMILPGVLTVTDLPELMTMAAPARVILRGPKTPAGAPIARDDLAARMGGAVPATVTWEAGARD